MVRLLLNHLVDFTLFSLSENGFELVLYISNDVFNSQIDVEVDNEQKYDDVTQTAAKELVSAPPGASLPPKSVKQEPTELNTQVENPDRPNTANSFSSGTSADSIPSLPPLLTTTNRKRVII